MTKTYCVITPSGMEVYSSSKRLCNAYLKQALTKGSEPGFLKIVTEAERDRVYKIAQEIEERNWKLEMAYENKE